MHGLVQKPLEPSLYCNSLLLGAKCFLGERFTKWNMTNQISQYVHKRFFYRIFRSQFWSTQKLEKSLSEHRRPRRYDQMEQLFTNRKFHFCYHRNFRVFFVNGKRPRFSTFSGNFPLGRTDETCSIYRRTGNFNYKMVSARGVYHLRGQTGRFQDW